MAIEEKKRALEFTFVPDNIEGDLSYDIVYDESNPVFPIRISSGGNAIDYPLELFVDVVEFLMSKGVVQPPPTTKIAPMPGPHAMGGTVPITPAGTAAASAIPLPQIAKKDGTEAPTTITANVDPLASFDIDTAVAAAPPAPSAPPIPAIPSAGPVVVGGQAKTSEVISRPVIRSRVKKGDPLSAEREAAQLRSAQGGGKSVKRVSGD